jgi:hypothetical protein
MESRMVCQTIREWTLWTIRQWTGHCSYSDINFENAQIDLIRIAWMIAHVLYLVVKNVL